jgi:cation-transporting ATPase E/undecaprenyl-diphosphatase
VATFAPSAAESPAEGLTEVEARRRRAARPRQAKAQSSRSYASIVRANVFTIFNLILAVFGGLVIAFGDSRDALFVGVLVANTAIGIFQEVRAKRALDRLAALVQPTATVVRDGRPRPVRVEELVVGDRVELQAGDQVVADGTLVAASGLSLDESILTGEAQPVEREAGEEVRSGSFAVEGAGAFVVTAVGEASYAARVTGEARAFRHPRSPLERAMNRLLLVLVGVIVPLGSLLGYALWTQQASAREAVSKSAAAVVTLVPEGLILLASLTYAVAAIGMSRRGVLVQQLNAVESLASVDTVCLDKTGTLTEPKPFVLEAVPADGSELARLRSLLARYAASSSSRNATLEAIAEAFRAQPEQPGREVPFSSRRKWSALRLGGESLVLGAPELFPLDGLAARAAQEASTGRRVVAFGRAADLPDEVGADDEPPADVALLGLVVIGEKLRPEARATVEFFRAQGVELKVISGDRPETAAAIAREAGIPVDGEPVDGRDLDPASALGASVIGRITPEGKRAVIEALRARGRYVAMVGDGVNDVPALKASRLAIAQGTGTQMARSVADLVLVRGDFAAVPVLVAEGRKLLRNLARVAKLFVAKSAFATFLILSIGLTETAYPLLPRHLTLAASVTIGIPAFFLALAPSSGPFEISGFLRSVARFAVPAGTATGLGVLSSYLFALDVVSRPLVEARTVATTTLVLVGLYLVYVLEGRGQLTRRVSVLGLCAAMLALYAAVLATSAGRSFFDLALGPALPASVAGSAFAAALLWLTDERFVPARP